MAELLRSDLKKINKDLRDRAMNHGSEEDLDDESEIEEVEATLDTRKDCRAGGIVKKETAIKDEPLDDDVHMTLGNQIHLKGSSTNDNSARSQYSLKSKAQIASLRADAMRLRQEAARREAEAYELEAKMLRAEAKELDSPTIKIDG